MPNTLPPLSDVIKRAELHPNKRLGQHFLLDQNLTDKIAKVAGDLSHCTVIEVGPGPGGLTRSLLEHKAQKVIAIEFDPRCKDILEEIKQVYGERFDYMIADALTVELNHLAQGPKKIVANLPYNVGTPLLIKWLQQIQEFESLTLMLQKEVAERLVAHPRSSSYGRLSVMTQWKANVEKLFPVSARAFTPPPEVESMVVQLRPHQLQENDPSWKAMELVTKTAFQKRRKMLRSTLKPLFGDQTPAVLEKLEIQPTGRAEELSVDQFVSLANDWQNLYYS